MNLMTFFTDDAIDIALLASTASGLLGQGCVSTLRQQQVATTMPQLAAADIISSVKVPSSWRYFLHEGLSQAARSLS